MKLLNLAFVLMTSLVVLAKGEPASRPVKVLRYHNAKEDLEQGNSKMKAMDSSSRLFMSRFFFNKNKFGQNQKPQIIPIIITGANTDDYTNIDTDTSTPIDTVTTTTLNTAPNTDIATNIDTAPTTDIATNIDTAPTTDDSSPVDGAPTDPINPGSRIIQLYGRGSKDDENYEYDEKVDEEESDVEDQTLAADVAAGAEEYIVMDQDIKGTSSSAKASRGPATINLRLRGSNQGQIVRVRVPASYSSYFKNGQRVILNRNKKNRSVKRRVVRRRKNRRRPNKNKNNKNKKNKNKWRPLVVA